MESKFRYSFGGNSRDLRTNVWNVTCLKCGKYFTPETTMLATQTIVCPNIKCKETEVVNYNNL
jgi:hypothetical protein